MLPKDPPSAKLILELKSSKSTCSVQDGWYDSLDAREKGWIRLHQIIKQNKIHLLTKAGSTQDMTKCTTETILQRICVWNNALEDRKAYFFIYYKSTVNNFNKKLFSIREGSWDIFHGPGWKSKVFVCVSSARIACWSIFGPITAYSNVSVFFFVIVNDISVI